MSTRQYTRHREEVRDFVHLVLRIPVELHGDILKEQERLRGTGKKMRLHDVAIKVIRDGLNDKA